MRDGSTVLVSPQIKLGSSPNLAHVLPFERVGGLPLQYALSWCPRRIPGWLPLQSVYVCTPSPVRGWALKGQSSHNVHNPLVTTVCHSLHTYYLTSHVCHLNAVLVFYLAHICLQASMQDSLQCMTFHSGWGKIRQELWESLPPATCTLLSPC